MTEQEFKQKLEEVKTPRETHRLLLHTPKELKANKELMKPVLKHTGLALYHMSQELRDDPEMLLLAMKQNPAAYSAGLQNARNDEAVKEYMLQFKRNNTMKNKITFVAPSFLLGKAGIEKLAKAKEDLEALGFEVTLAKHIKSNPKTTPSVKAKDLVDAFNSDTDIVWSVGGGEGMIETMKCLDFDKIKDNSKLFIGFSDNTCLTYTLATHFNQPSIVGYNGKRMSKLYKTDRKDVLRMIDGDKDFSSYDFWDNEENDELKPPYEYLNYEGPVSGILLGGCVEVLKDLQDAGLDNTVNFVNNHKEEGIIFFLDNDGANPDKLRENLESFKAAGWFDNVKMFIASRNYYYYKPETREKLNKVYKEVLGSVNVPLVLNADVGHMEPLIPLYIGKKCTVSKTDSKLMFHYE